jgi:hypothetical protein
MIMLENKTPATPREIMQIIAGGAVAALIFAGVFATNIYFRHKEEAWYESFANTCVSIPPLKYAKVIGLHYEPGGYRAPPVPFFHMVEVNGEGKKFEVTEPARNIVNQPVVACDPKYGG